MSFLAPAWLALSALAAVPLLLHLLRRRLTLKIDFPAVRYLLRAEKEHSRRLRLRNLLLMVLRVLAVLAVALAAAHPVARVGGSGHGPTALALVLDNSLSTSVVVDGRPVIDRLREAARSALSHATDADRLWLVTADGRVAGGSRATLDAMIARVEPLGGRGDVQAASARAAALVGASGMPGRRVAVVTDAQASSWDGVVRAGDVGVAIYAPDVRVPPNHAVVDARAAPARWTPTGSVTVRVDGADSVVYRIALGTSARTARTVARGTARRGEEVVLHASPPERGWLSGVAELEPDELRGDDARWFATWVGPAPLTLLDPSAGPFIRNAMDALVSSGRAQPGNDIIVASADATPKLPAILLAPSAPVRLGAANRALERLGVPWRFGLLRRGDGTVRGERMEGVTVSSRYALVQQAGAASETLSVAGGEPWIVAGPGYVLVGSPLDPSSTTFPIRAGFVPWLGDVLAQRLAGDAGGVIASAPSARIRRLAGSDRLEAPDGVATALVTDTMTAPPRAGVYFFRRGSARVGALVVNPEAAESRLDRMTLRDLRSRVRGSDVVVERDAKRWSDLAFGTGAGRPLDTVLLIIALGALLAELVAARRGEHGATTAKAA